MHGEENKNQTENSSFDGHIILSKHSFRYIWIKDVIIANCKHQDVSHVILLNKSGYITCQAFKL